VANKRHKQIHGHLTVRVRYISVPGAEARLAQAVDLLLKSAAMNDITTQEDADLKVKNLPAHDAKGNQRERTIKGKG
jgi:hypothetical protein